MTDPTLRIEKVGESTDESTGHTHHTHDVYEGERKVGSFQALTHPDKPLSFKLGGGLKMKHARPVFDYMSSTFGKSKEANREARKMTEGLAANTRDSKRGAGAPIRELASINEAYRSRASSKSQKVPCTTEGCEGTPEFLQVRNKHGFEQMVEHCPSCKATNPVKRRPATTADSTDATQVDASRARWNNENMSKAAPSSSMTGPMTGQVVGPIDPKIDLDHDRRRLKTAIRNLLGTHESPHKPDGKVNLAKSLAKSLHGQAKYRVLVPKMHRLVEDIVNRPEFDAHHDHAAFMIKHAQSHLNMARNHMLQTEPTKVDSARNLLGLEPLHMKHLAAAATFLHGATVYKTRGDHNLYARGVITEMDHDMKRDIPADHSGLKVIKQAYGGMWSTPQSAARLVQGHAAELRKRVLRTDETGTNVVRSKDTTSPKPPRGAPGSND